MKLYAGFDRHSNNSYLRIIDENGRRVFKRKLRNDSELIVTVLNLFKSDIEVIVVESTFNWFWLVDLLSDEKYQVHLANPTKIQQYAGLSIRMILDNVNQ